MRNFTRIFHIFIDAHVSKVRSFPDQLLTFVCVLIIFSYCNENAMDSIPRKSKPSSITFYLLNIH